MKNLRYHRYKTLLTLFTSSYSCSCCCWRGEEIGAVLWFLGAVCDVYNCCNKVVFEIFIDCNWMRFLEIIGWGIIFWNIHSFISSSFSSSIMEGYSSSRWRTFVEELKKKTIGNNNFIELKLMMKLFLFLSYLLFYSIG